VRPFPFVQHLFSGLVLAAWAASPLGTANAAPIAELPSVLVIAKSSNKNQVHYAARINEVCALTGPSPVRPYWRMLERGPYATEPLREGEQRVLGIERQAVGDDGVQIALRGMPARPITIHTWRGPDGHCSASAEMTIAGMQARVDRVYVQQKLFGIDYVLLTGHAEDGSIVRERVWP
jgi:hypothetical protein